MSFNKIATGNNNNKNGENPSTSPSGSLELRIACGNNAPTVSVAPVAIAAMRKAPFFPSVLSPQKYTAIETKIPVDKTTTPAVVSVSIEFVFSANNLVSAYRE